ncbi:MAG: hypothetical protein J5732_02855 [Bacteroidaceae bacterium]|nr:hypothetical protein [Bacteroidaceae bacterium]
MDIREIIREHLLIKGTKEKTRIEGDTIVIDTNHFVSPKDLVRSGLFIYGLKDNATNRSAIVYYCERWARINQIMEGPCIKVPEDLWKECDKKNCEFTQGKDREV